MDSFLASVLLVLATGLVSLGVAWQQNRFAAQRSSEERQQAAIDRRRAEAREHAAELLSALSEIIQRAIESRPSRPKLEDYAEALATARRTYLLIPSEVVRASVADGLTVMASAEARDVEAEDFREAATATSFVLAAYMRGDEPDAGYVAQLARIRAAYPGVRISKQLPDPQNGVSSP